MLSALWEHFGQVCCMALIIFGAQALARRSQRKRVHAEAQRLRGALTLMLSALRNIHEDNLRVLSGAKPPLMSGRNQMVLLRTQLARLLVLNQAEIEAVLAANIAAEAAEAIMAVCGKVVAGVAYTVPKDDEEVTMLRSSLLRACSILRAAESLLNSDSILSPLDLANEGESAALMAIVADGQSPAAPETPLLPL